MVSSDDGPPQHIERPRILVADDEHMIADTLAIILRQSGFDTAVVYDGKETVEKARSSKQDLLLIDVVTSQINGDRRRHSDSLPVPGMQSTVVLRPSGDG